MKNSVDRYDGDLDELSKMSEEQNGAILNLKMMLHYKKGIGTNYTFNFRTERCLRGLNT